MTTDGGIFHTKFSNIINGLDKNLSNKWKKKKSDRFVDNNVLFQKLETCNQ